jgi:predicted TIM-barrel fold metal-dependent hydrolase
MVIDINMHSLPDNLFDDDKTLESYVRIAPKAHGEFARVELRSGKKQLIVEKPRGYENLNFSYNSVDAALRIETMDKAGIDKAILRTPCWQEWLTLDMCKELNGNNAKVVSQNPDRLTAVATVPPWGDKSCLFELERCIKELGFVGVELAAHFGEIYLDDEVFRPHFRRIAELDVPVVVHHTPLPVEYHSLYEYTNVRRSIGRCIDQLIAVNREVFSDLFDECPSLKIVHTMLGGAYFAFTNQISMRKSGLREEAERFDPIGERFNKIMKNNIFFDITTPTAWSKAQLECAVAEIGAANILYSSSYPVRLDWVMNGVEHLRSLDISDEEKQLIFEGNAKRLFKIS